jgi:hypothetical protein
MDSIIHYLVNKFLLHLGLSYAKKESLYCRIPQHVQI